MSSVGGDHIDMGMCNRIELEMGHKLERQCDGDVRLDGIVANGCL